MNISFHGVLFNQLRFTHSNGFCIDLLLFSDIIQTLGAVAQLGERLVRSEKAASSTLVCSIRR